MSSPHPASLPQPVGIFPVGWGQAGGAAFSLLKGLDVLPSETHFSNDDSVQNTELCEQLCAFAVSQSSAYFILQRSTVACIYMQ